MNQIKPPRNEIWFRKLYTELVLSHQVTTIFRPGKRNGGNPKGFSQGEEVHVRIIEHVGAEWAGVYGQVRPDVSIPARITQVEVLQLGELKPEDFAGSTPDVSDVQSLITHLGLLYNLSLKELTSTTLVTRTTFEYL